MALFGAGIYKEARRTVIFAFSYLNQLQKSWEENEVIAMKLSQELLNTIGKLSLSVTAESPHEIPPTHRSSSLPAEEHTVRRDFNRHLYCVSLSGH
jgi:hypothetical protein